MHALTLFANKLAKILCLIGGVGFLFAVLATCWSALGKVTLRQLNAAWGAENIPGALAWIRPLSGEDEIVAFAVCFALFSALPFVTLQRAHIRIDLFRFAFGNRLNRLLDLFADALMVVIAYFFVRQQWNLIFKPARTSRGQDPLLDLVWQGNWAQIWDERFLDSKQTQVMGLAYWPLHLWAEVCSVLFLAAALIALLRSVQNMGGTAQ